MEILWEMTGMAARNLEARSSQARGAVPFLGGLARRHNFLMDGAVARRSAALSNRIWVSMDSVFLDLACGDLRDTKVPQERRVEPAIPSADSPLIAGCVVLPG